MKIVFSLLFTVFLVGCANIEVDRTQSNPDQQDSAFSQQVETDSQSAEQSLSITLTAQEDGQTAFELLEDNATVEVQQFGDAGVFVSGINGLNSDDEHYWALHVNGEYSQTGASQTILKAGDEVEYVYERIDPSL